MQEPPDTTLAERFDVFSSIPVLPMFNEEESKAFYCEFLDYQVDWEHRFRDDTSSPLYMQIRFGRSVLHLNGHAERDAPGFEVRIPVRDLAGYCAHLGAKRASLEQPCVVDPRYEGRGTDLNLDDPSGNRLVFWTPTALASSSPGGPS